MTVVFMIFWRFLKISQRFSKIVPKARRTFPNIFREMISSHVRILYRFYIFVTTPYTTDFYIIMSSSRKYPYLPHRRDFFLTPPHSSGNSNKASYIFLSFDLPEPSIPQEIPIPSVGGSMDIFWSWTIDKMNFSECFSSLQFSNEFRLAIHVLRYFLCFAYRYMLVLDVSRNINIQDIGGGSHLSQSPQSFRLVLWCTFIVRIYCHFPSNKSFKLAVIEILITQQEFQTPIDLIIDLTNSKTFLKKVMHARGLDHSRFPLVCPRPSTSFCS